VTATAAVRRRVRALVRRYWLRADATIVGEPAYVARALGCRIATARRLLREAFDA